ncbi:MAG TPA: hypothetical protein VFC78_15395 [Tepidisphaeraceae bacterium]|nr:hypothetical protein [Tepidisphaeraceae bacterium]
MITTYTDADYADPDEVDAARKLYGLPPKKRDYPRPGEQQADPNEVARLRKLYGLPPKE